MVISAEMMAGSWATWEELLLGGAVLRHGTGDWDVVAVELRARTLRPQSFTPEACKAKYEDLQSCYSGYKAWFEELKKKRMAELRAALKQSEDSIGSLESKLESLKSESKNESHNDYDSSRTVSIEQCQKSEGAESTSKDTSKDLSSAGSFTLRTEPNGSPQPRLEASALEQEKNSYNDKVAEKISWCGQLVTSIRRRRGKRKRKDCSKDEKEGSVEESHLLGSCADVARASTCKEMSTSNYDDQRQGHCLLEPDELMKLYNSVAENDCASVFRRRLDSQKRGRFKKLVRRHMDMDTIKSRISNRSISSAKELFRDLFIVTNNALVFYSKNTREYKSAFRLRDLVTNSLKKHMNEDHGSRTHVVTAFSSTNCLAKKPRSVRPPKKPSGEMAAIVHDVIKTPNGGKRTFGTDSPPSMESFPTVKREISGPRKAVGRSSKLKSDSTRSRGRKRTRVR